MYFIVYVCFVCALRQLVAYGTRFDDCIDVIVRGTGIRRRGYKSGYARLGNVVRWVKVAGILKLPILNIFNMQTI